MAGGGRLLAGITIILFVIVVNGLVGYFTNGTNNVENFGGCTSSDTNTTCENVGKTTFLAAALDVSTTGIDGAPAIVNNLYVAITVILLAAGVLLIVLAFVPLTS